ncbi:MAG: MarR family transcriptional regulator [Actinomycetes bacterium]
MTRWLTREQQAHWRAWLAATKGLQDQLNRELQEQHGLTTTDYEILVRLSESENNSIRMSDLATKTLLSRSRLSHQVDRMESAGLIERQTCADDRRGQLAVLTKVGTKALVAAAPDHVMGVRKHLVDLLSDEEFQALGSAAKKIANHLDGL